MPDPAALFDRAAVRAHRDRAGRIPGAHDFLFDEVAGRLADRLDDAARGFPLALDLGCRAGAIADRLAARSGVETLVRCDLSPVAAGRAAGTDGAAPSALALAADEEHLPFATGTFDLVVSALSLHWVNDLPGALVQIRRSLRPNGLFLAAMFGAGTLHELRRALTEAEVEIEGGAGPRVSPFADLADCAALLQRAGFTMPVADGETITVTYADAFALMRDLRGMGETNALRERRRGFTRRSTLARAAALYHDLYAGPEGRVPATFRIVTLTGWAP